MDYGKEQKFDLDQYNLDTDEWDYSPEHDARALGNKVISSPETLTTSTAETPKSPEPSQISPSMPPGYPHEPESLQTHLSPASVEPPADSPITSLAQKAQSSEKFTYHDAKIVETSVVSELAQTGDIASVYEEVRVSSAPTEEAP